MGCANNPYKKELNRLRKAVRFSSFYGMAGLIVRRSGGARRSARQGAKLRKISDVYDGTRAKFKGLSDTAWRALLSA